MESFAPKTPEQGISWAKALVHSNYTLTGTTLPHRELLTESQRLSLQTPASDERGRVRHYTLSSEDLALINRRRGREVVHTLYSKVQDIGADRGVIFSESGFQEGARTAAQTTNILLQTSLEDFGRTARLHLDRIPLVPEEAEEPDAPPVHRFPNRYRPHHLLKYEGRLFVANWGVPQVGNIAIIDPNSRAIEGVIDLDRYERRIRNSSRQAILQHPPGNMDQRAYLNRMLRLALPFFRRRNIPRENASSNARYPGLVGYAISCSSCAVDMDQ